MHPPLRDQARGRWRSILPAFGVDPRVLDGKHHPCPHCAGRDRFRWDNKDGHGTFFCSQCGAGDGAELAGRVSGLAFVSVAAKIRALLQAGNLKEQPMTTERSDADKESAWRALWSGAAEITQGDPVSLYLGNRLGQTPSFRCLKYVPSLTYKGEAVSRHPALIALVAGADGKAVNVHRTYLTLDGKKADVPSPRRMMPGLLPDGSAVRLAPSAPVMGVAEGIETALAASILYRMPVWAAINARGLATFTAPDTVENLVVYGDHDLNYVGQAAAYECARRNVGIARNVAVMIPDAIGQDWNDVLLQEKQEMAA